MEKRINKLFDELTLFDAALAGDECRIERYDEERAERILSLTQRKAGITMKETTNTQKKRRRIKRTTFIAIAAAAVLTCTAAAAAVLPRERVIENVFGEDAVNELTEKGIIVNKATVTEHFTFTVIASYATDRYARIIMTLEGTDNTGRDFIKEHSNGDICAEMIALDEYSISEFGHSERMNYDEQTGCLMIDMQIAAKPLEGSSYKFILTREGDNIGIPIMKEYLSSIKRLAAIDFTIRQNTEPIRFICKDLPDISLCDYEIFISPLAPYDFRLLDGCGEKSVLTFIYKDKTRKTLDLSQTEKSMTRGVIFKGTTIDSEKVEKIIIGDGKYTYTSAE